MREFEVIIIRDLQNIIQRIYDYLEIKRGEGYFFLLEDSINYILRNTSESIIEGYVIFLEKKVYLISDSRYEEDIYLNSLDKYFEIVMREGSLGKTINEILENYGNVSDLYLESGVSHGDFLQYEMCLKTQVLSMDKDLSDLRVIKSPYEIKMIREAARINDSMVQEAFLALEVGKSEVEIRNIMENHLRIMGAQKSSFDLIVASGFRSSLPHGLATKKKIVYNEPILLDTGTVYENYASDMTRMAYIGKPKKEFLEDYKILLNCQREAIEMVKEGVEICLLETTVRKKLAKYDLSEYFTHSLGHGVGLNIHELPHVNSKNNDVFKENMVITIEPGIYKKNQYGIRIEDLCLVTKDKALVLSKTEKELKII